MQTRFRNTLSLAVFLATASTAQATVACSVVSDTDDTNPIGLFSDPDPTAPRLREIPLGDLVEYPQEELAPTQAEGWAWVRHDITQDVIWQTGLFGWIQTSNIADCG